MHLIEDVASTIQLLLAILGCSALVGCGSSVASDCADPSKTSAPLEIAVAPAYAAGELVIRGDCQTFACAQQASGGCVLWTGTISTEGNSACQLTLYQGDAMIESMRVTGGEACGTARKRVTLGDTE